MRCRRRGEVGARAPRSSRANAQIAALAKRQARGGVRSPDCGGGRNPANRREAGPDNRDFEPCASDADRRSPCSRSSLGACSRCWHGCPWNPLEAGAGRLDLLLPSDLPLVVRLQPDTALDSPAGRTLWAHPVVAGVREDLAVEDRLLAPLRRVEDALAELTRGIGARPTVRGDLLGRDVLIGVRDEEILVVSRMSARARALEIIRRVDAAELASHGLRLDGDVVVFEREGAPTVFAARHRDVLLLSTSREMVQSARDRGAATHGYENDTEYTTLLEMDRSPGMRVLFFARPAEFAGPGPAEMNGDPAPETALTIWRGVFPPARLGPSHGEVDLSRWDRVSIRLSSEYAGELPERVVAFPSAVDGGARALRAEAARLALPGEAVVVAGVAVRAEQAIRALVDAQPAKRSALFEDVLADEGTSVAEVATQLAGHLEDGAGFVVARLDEVDDLELDDPIDGGQAHPIAATLVVFRLADGAGDALLDDLAKRSESLFGGPLELAPVALPGGARLYGPAHHTFGAMWRLLTPCCAIVDGLFVFSTNAAYLQRALRYRHASGDPALARTTGRTATASVSGFPLGQFFHDQRWEWAHQRTYHDWKAERQAIRRDLDLSSTARSAADRMSFENHAIQERINVRNETEFPAALSEYREMWTPLDVVGDVTIDATLSGRAFEIVIDLGLTEP